MRDLVELIAEYVGNHTLYERKLERLVFTLMERSDLLQNNHTQRKRKHIGQGIMLAVRMICFELNIIWGVGGMPYL